MTEHLPAPQRSVGALAYYRPEILVRMLTPLLDADMPDRKVLLGTGVEIENNIVFLGMVEFPELNHPRYGCTYIRFGYLDLHRINDIEALVHMVDSKVRMFKASVESALKKRMKGEYSTSRSYGYPPDEEESDEPPGLGVIAP